MSGHLHVKKHFECKQESVYTHIRGVTEGTDQTSGGCSLCYTIPI